MRMSVMPVMCPAEALDVLGVMCASHKWVSLRLDGSCSVKQRQALVDTFNDQQHPSFVLLLSSKAGGVGLNIIGANRLVLFDPDWNPANDLQAMARVSWCHLQQTAGQHCQARMLVIRWLCCEVRAGWHCSTRHNQTMLSLGFALGRNELLYPALCSAELCCAVLCCCRCGVRARPSVFGSTGC